MVEWNFPMAGEFARQVQEESVKNVQRFAKGMELVYRPKEPRVGRTPREPIYKRNKSILYRYGPTSERRHAVPVLMVPNLGISRPYIFDLYPGSSFVEHMVKQGFDFYLLDWGVFGDEDNGLTVDECVTQILPVMVRKALKSSGTRQVTLLGYCMGGPLSACYAAQNPEPVQSLINMAGPIDYKYTGMFSTWLDKRYFDVDKLVDTFGCMPADMVRLGFKMLKPTMDLSTFTNLWWNLWDDRYVEGFLALNKWANEYVPFPGEFFRQWVKEFYQENKLIRNELSLGGRPVSLSNIHCPLLVVGAKQDYICPPECARALMDSVSSTDKEYLELPGGHISLIAGRGAARHVWPKVSAWIAQRSQAA
ncbi:MAG TPA: alpha/beta fold hydrolase [Candidatus Methylomirabilis sp.]|nr:alpha/beta fold hydrolase [Candidatus Methylomirabilis sp.]